MRLQHLPEHTYSRDWNRADSSGTIAPMATSPIGEDAREAWVSVFNAHRRITRETERRLQEAGLPPLGWYDVLYSLLQCPEGRMNQSALAARVQVSPSGLSRLVDRMVSRGLIERRDVPGDRRAAELVLTDAATDTMRDIWAVYGGVLAEHFAPAVAGREVMIADLFQEVSDSLEGICRTRIAEAEAQGDLERSAASSGA
jgi:DNA-binding MarR family transcriptional regulator